MKATIWDYGRMIIEYDKELHEIIITITFPKDGRYKSLLYLSSADDQDSFHLFTNFYFDVKNSKKRSKVSPYELIFEGQKFVPIEEKDIQIEPSDSAIITNNPSFEIACSVNKGSTLVLNLNDPHQQTIFGIQRGKESVKSNGKHKNGIEKDLYVYYFTMNTFGIHQLHFF
jgi:hypothetical protein